MKANFASLGSLQGGFGNLPAQPFGQSRGLGFIGFRQHRAEFLPAVATIDVTGAGVLPQQTGHRPDHLVPRRVADEGIRIIIQASVTIAYPPA